jgi:hypothetical protein
MTNERTGTDFLDRFATGTSARELSDAATGLIQTKKIHTARESAEFQEGLSHLREFAIGTVDGLSRLHAVATLQRLRAVLKKRAASVEMILKEALIAELPSAQLLDDAKVRVQLGSALSMSVGDWVLDYSARELILEGLSDKAAMAFASVLLKRSKSVELALISLGAHTNDIPNGSGKLADAAARRLRRVLIALRTALKLEAPEVGETTPKQLRAFLRIPLERSSFPEDRKSVKEFVDALASFIDDLIRLRLSLVVDSELYLVLTLCRRWCPASIWENSVTRSAKLKALARTLSDGIRISSRQGVTDQGLFDALELVLGSKEKALLLTRRLVDEAVGLPDNVQRWLRSGRVSGGGADSVFATQNELLQSDQYVATALLEALNLEAKANLSDPLHGLLTAVRSLASARNLAIFQTEGEVVPYSPHQHVVVSGLADSNKVRVVRPGIERTDAAGNRQVVVKAMVEPVK